MLDSWIKQTQQQWHKLTRCQKWLCRTTGISIGMLLCIRALPYLAPIRAETLRQNDQAIELSDRNGLPLGTLLSRDRNHTAFIPLNDVSPQFIQAILATEDRRFFEHGPLDLQAILRAIAEAIQARRIMSGASTVTMQLARMIDPTPATVPGKLQEIWTAWRIAAGMNHREILQAYINRLPMGGNIYGIEAASRVYFGISSRDLNLAQASLLAALPNDPTRLNPYHRLAKLKQRQRYVLAQMVRDRHISPTQAQQALAESVTLLPRQQGILAAPHFLFWVSRHLPATPPARLRTTLDRPLQQFVEAQAQQIIQGLSAQNVHQAAAVVIENATGEVLAYVGSINYFNGSEEGQNDGVQALRQPGSTLKPFLYQLALDQKKIRPNTILADVPTAYAIPGARLYRPVDYHEQFQGPVRVRIALANSLNVPAVKLLDKIGVPTFLAYLRELGFTHLTHPPDYYGLGLTLGSGEVTLWELARAYLTLANQGQSKQLQVLHAEPHQSPPSTSSSLLKPNTPAWFLVTDMLSDRFARAQAFGVDSLLSLPFPSAVKTGTSSDFRDTWTVGYTTDFTVATWVGNFDGEPMQNVSGVTGAAPLWNRIMLHLHEHREPKAFPVPPGLVERPICAISGHKPTPACPTVVREYLYPEDLAEYQHQPDPFFTAIASATPNASPQYRLNLPPEYNTWLAAKPTATLSSGQFRILSPRNGDYFVMQSPAKRSGQHPTEQLEFKLTGISSQPIEWRLNGQRLSTSAQDSLFWPMQPGQWRLDAKSGAMRDRVDFEVQLAPQSTSHKGFSVRKP